MKDISRLQRVALRQVWPHEAQDFTRWLQNNLDVLNETLGLDLASAEREQSAGNFSVDLIAEDGSGNLVIIENQLERSNHDHLGKLITYLSMVGAETAVWIVSDPRPEHISAISWLNESSSGYFYLVKVEAVRIADSPAAPLLTLIVGPSEEIRGASETKREFSERHQLRLQFWTSLLERASERTDLHNSISPSNDSWIGTGAGVRGLNLNYVILQDNTRVELYIDRGPDAHDENREVFDYLHSHKDEIESTFGEALEWDNKPERRGCKIVKLVGQGGYRGEDWTNTQMAMIDTMIRLEKALRPFISQLKAKK